MSEVAGVLEARRLLEPRVAQLAAVHASEDDFAVMAALIERKRELARRDDVLRHEDLFLQLDLKFHLAMAHATRNSTVVSLMRSLFKRLEIARDMAVHAPPVPDWVIDVHERTLAAIRSADFPAIEAVMDEHLAQLEQIWEQETGRGLVRPLPDFLQPVAERSRGLARRLAAAAYAGARAENGSFAGLATAGLADAGRRAPERVREGAGRVPSSSEGAALRRDRRLELDAGADPSSVLEPGRANCARRGRKLFREFLEDYDGRLAAGWAGRRRP